ncbi:MAG TPA: DCC1-like thiol-disulfide oxidoreductase family protein [Opitutaceae bacterium]|nr:DCC1-like thiol-disulfide oxidoreductase family protein [Opitutaceae bacterium]
MRAATAGRPFGPGVFFAFGGGFAIVQAVTVPDPFPDPVLLFDGECGLCNRVVRGLLRIDRGQRLRFAALQGDPAQSFLRERGLPTHDFDTLVLVTNWKERTSCRYLLRTDGVIASLRACGGFGRILAAGLALIPAPWRDAVYRLVGHTRYRWFGPWRPCPLAKPEWGARFLDAPRP